MDLQKVVGCCRMGTKESVHDFDDLCQGCSLCLWWPCIYKRDLKLSHFHALRHSWYLSILQWSLVVRPCLKLWAKFLGETNEQTRSHIKPYKQCTFWTSRHWTWFPWVQRLICLERSKWMIVIQGQCCDREMWPLDKDWRFPTRGDSWCLVLLTFKHYQFRCPTSGESMGILWWGMSWVFFCK